MTSNAVAIHARHAHGKCLSLWHATDCIDTAPFSYAATVHPKIFGSADAKTVVVTYAAFGCWDDGLGNATCSRSPTIGGGGASIFEYVAKGNAYEEVYVLPSTMNVTQDAGNYSVNLYGDVQFAAVSADGKRVVLHAGYGILRVRSVMELLGSRRLAA